MLWKAVSRFRVEGTKPGRFGKAYGDQDQASRMDVAIFHQHRPDRPQGRPAQTFALRRTAAENRRSARSDVRACEASNDLDDEILQNLSRSELKKIHRSIGNDMETILAAIMELHEALGQDRSERDGEFLKHISSIHVNLVTLFLELRIN